MQTFNARKGVQVQPITEHFDNGALTIRMYIDQTLPINAFKRIQIVLGQHRTDVRLMYSFETFGFVLNVI